MNEAKHGEWHGEQAQEHVGQRQVSYEDVASSLQHLENVNLSNSEEEDGDKSVIGFTLIIVDSEGFQLY